MKTVAIIPARRASTRFPDKLMKMFLNRPIVINVYENAKKVSLVDDCIIATDSVEIMDMCKNYNAKAVMTDTCHESGTSRITEVAKNIDADIIINVQGDEPLVDESVLIPLIECFKNKEVDIATLKFLIEESEFINDENAVKVVTDVNDYAMYFSRATIPFVRSGNSAVPKYYKHIGVYAFRKEALLKIENLAPCEYENIERLEQLRWLYNGFKIKVIETKTFLHGVDTKEDLEYLEKHIKGLKLS